MLARERSDQLVEQWSKRIGRWRLALPSILFLEVVKPFSFIASQGLLLSQPLLSFFELERQTEDYANLLADRKNIDRLIARLEQENLIRSKNSQEED